jgi:hypothetical protein
MKSSFSKQFCVEEKKKKKKNQKSKYNQRPKSKLSKGLFYETYYSHKLLIFVIS